MASIGGALRQAFMPKHEYESLREEDKVLQKLHKPLISLFIALISLAVLISSSISLKIVFPSDNLHRPFCREARIQPLPVNFTSPLTGESSDLVTGAFVLTDQETVDYYWMVVFVPSVMIFAASIVYLIAGIAVACAAPVRHGCLKVVENSYCASRRGGVRCLSILNAVFATIFGLLALFLGSTLLTLGSSCSLTLFWCYEISMWSLVIIHGGAAFFLRRKVLDESESVSSRNLGIEMFETSPAEFTPEVERRVSEGFKSWMGPSFLSSDEEDEPDDYLEVSNVIRTNSTRLRV